MYMYYFLGYQLMEDKTLTSARKEVRSENTFLLALDGDVDFQPEAIIKVVDLMKRNPKVGAACGRIHPTGSGVMQWYQKFEYAIGRSWISPNKSFFCKIMFRSLDAESHGARTWLCPL